jgi:hypothetical protein
MNETQIYGVSGAFIVLAGITVAVTRNWLPLNNARPVIVFVAGVLIILSLRFAGLPPIWFAGGAKGFGMVVFFAATAFVGIGQPDRFQWPLCLGMALTLLVCNVIVHF